MTSTARISKEARILRAASGFAKGGGIGKHAIDPHRVGDVLDMAITEQLVSANQLVLYLFVDAAGDIDFAGLGYAFKPRGDIDAVAVNVVGFDDDIAKIDANSILDPMMLGSDALRPTRFC